MISWPLALVSVVFIIAAAETVQRLHKRRHKRKMKRLEQQSELDEKMLEWEIKSEKDTEYNE